MNHIRTSMANIIITKLEQIKETSIALVGGVAASLLGIIRTIPGELMVLSFVVAIASSLFGSQVKDEKIKVRFRRVAHVSFAFAVVAFVFFLTQQLNYSSDKKKEAVYLITAEACNHLSKNELPWLTESELKARRVSFILIPGDTRNQKTLSSVFSEILTSQSYNLFAAGRLEKCFLWRNPECRERFAVVVIDCSYLRKKIPSRFKILPSSISVCVLAEMKLRTKDWETAEKLLRQADSEGNAYGTYRLAQMYEEGFGRQPDSKEARKLMKKSAERGFQVAQNAWAKDILYDPSSTREEIALAEDYLRKATKLVDYRDELCYSVLHDSTYELVSLYSVQKDVLRSYFFTWRMCRDYPSLYYPKMEHIRNCLVLHRYKTAQRLIRECESLPEETIHKETLEYVFIEHAWMLIEGKGVKKNLAEGERLLKYAADTLNFYPAWLELSNFYSLIDRPSEADFYKDLYEIKYSNRMNLIDEAL